MKKIVCLAVSVSLLCGFVANAQNQFTAAEQLEFNIGERARIGNFLKQYRENTETVGGSIKAVDGQGNTLLHHAAFEWDVAVAKFLISKGANVNARNNRGFTPLHAAAEGMKIEVAKFLVSKGADVNAKNNADATPINTARARATVTGKNFMPMIQYLASVGGRETSFHLIGAQEQKGRAPNVVAMPPNVQEPSRCGACKGTGRVQCGSCNGGRITCKNCMGTGKDNRGGTCGGASGCGGKGYKACTSLGCYMGTRECYNCKGQGDRYRPF